MLFPLESSLAEELSEDQIVEAIKKLIQFISSVLCVYQENMKSLVLKLIELIKKYMRHEASVRAFCFCIERIIGNLIEFGCVNENDAEMVVDLLEICFSFGWFSLLRQENPLITRLRPYLEGRTAAKNVLLLCSDSESCSAFEAKADALVPTLEFPSGVSQAKFLHELSANSKVTFSKDAYLVNQDKNSLFMTMIVKDILALFSKLNKETQGYVLAYIRKLASVELRNEASPIIIHTLVLAELCEWHFNCLLERSVGSEENVKGELWSLNE